MAEPVCQVPGCGATVSRTRFLCEVHWHRVPVAIRAGLQRTATPGATPDHETDPRWLRYRDTALRLAGGKP